MLLSTGAMVAQYIGQTVNLALKKPRYITSTTSYSL